MNKRRFVIVLVLVVIGVLATASVAFARGGAEGRGQLGLANAGAAFCLGGEACDGICDGTGAVCDGECDGIGLRLRDGSGANCTGECDPTTCTQDQLGTRTRAGGRGLGAGRMGACTR